MSFTWSNSAASVLLLASAAPQITTGDPADITATGLDATAGILAVTTYWGPLFPDAAGATFTIPAVAASLALEPPQTNSGAMETVVLRARVPGTGGNGIRVAFEADALVVTGELSEVASDVTIKFVDQATTVSDIVNLINTASTLIEAIGPYSPADLLIEGDDEFAFTDLEGGLDARPGVRARYWGPLFPDQPLDVNSPPAVDPLGPETVGTLMLRLEAGTSVTYGWTTDVFKSYSGKERRASVLDDPRLTFEGTALLLGSETRDVRNQIARYAALGRPFLLALPYESATLTVDAVGAVVTVPNAGLLDWANPGQRVLLRFDGESDEFVIQSVSGNEIALDVDPGALGTAGAELMPGVAVLLEPQQSFARYQTPNGAEVWSIKARAVEFGFQQAAVPASLAIGDPITVSGALDAAVLRARTPGVAGNAITVEFSADALVGTGEIEEDTVAGTVLIKFIDEETTVADVQLLFDTASTLVTMIPGETDPDSVLIGAEDAFGPENLAGGLDSQPAEMGRGATVTERFGRSLWDRGVENPSTISDSVHSLTEIVDLGGIPEAYSSATIPDGGRALAFSTSGDVAAFQWFKAFIAEQRARWRTWWLPTYRQDLVAIGNGPGGGTSGSITISTAVGEFDLWYSSHGYRYLEVVQSSGTYYVEVTATVDNGDGTMTLSVETDGDTIPAAGAISRLSWLEPARFEGDGIAVAFTGAGLAAKSTARVIQPVDPDSLLSTWADYEQSLESSEPKEGIEIDTPAGPHRFATGSRDVVIDGKTFPAQPAMRGGVSLTVAGENNEVEISIPVSHAFCQRYILSPPGRVTVALYRRQPAADADVVIYRGSITSGAIDGHIMKFRSISLMGETLNRRLPVLTEGRSCPYILYDDNCRVNRGDFTIETTIASFDGNAVTVASIGGKADHFAQFGALLHVPTGELIPIADQVGTLITLEELPFGIANGDSVQVIGGCDHLIATCDADFDNRENFGGSPHMPTKNPFLPNGYGIYQSE